MDSLSYIEPKTIEIERVSEMYDQYAPVLYGNIVRVLPQGPIAEKVFEKVFVQSCNFEMMSTAGKTPLIAMLNAARKKSKNTLTALNIFRACWTTDFVKVDDGKPE